MIRWSVGAKIASGFVLALILLSAIGVSAYRSITETIAAAAWRSHTHIVITDLEELFSAIKDAESGQRGFLITGHEEYLDHYNDVLKNYRAMLAEIRQLTKDNAEQQHRLEVLQSVVVAKMERIQKSIELRRNGKADEAIAIVQTGQGRKLMDDIRYSVTEMIAEERKLLEIREEKLKSDANRSVAIIVYGIPFAFVLLMLVGWLITRNISQPLREISEAAQLIANGDLSLEPTADVTRSDEVGVLVRSFNIMIRSLQSMASAAQLIADGDIRNDVVPRSERDVLGNAFSIMIKKLRDITREINSGVNVLVAAAAEISASTTQMSAGSAETATAVSQTTSTVEEVKQTAQLASDKAKRVSDNAQNAVQITEGGKQSVQDFISAMQRIQDQMHGIAESIVLLAEQSQAIGEIIVTVNDLAEQSNLLAVNATIEAAKVGEQGKGFAVVAQEVKSLAAQSKQATAQVRNILGDIQKATNAVVITTEQGSREVESGGKLSVKLDDAIRGLSDSINEAARAASQIAASSQQQLVGMDQVAMAMQSIRDASTQNVASAKQTEVAAQDLHQLGLKLKHMLNYYKYE